MFAAGLERGAAVPHASQAPYYTGPPQAYGAFDDAVPAAEGKTAPRAFVRGQRRRINIVPIVLAVFWPWVLFSAMLAVMSFSLRYEHQFIAYLFIALGLLLVGANGIFAADAARKKAKNDPSREPTWFVFMFLTSLLAWIVAVGGGDVNFLENMQPFYDVMNLNTYLSIDPAFMRGQMLMDAGRVMFTPDARLDITRSMGFKNLDVFCVAPITKANATGTESLATYDFWAVGVNCCSGNNPDFHCGQFANPRAHGGLRLMQDNQRPYFRLAVQQAEAAYNIKAVHPLFFEWMEDPIAEVDAFRDDGYKCYLLGVCSYFALQLFLVAAAVVAFSKLGMP